MWLPRIVLEVASSERPVALLGGESFGAPFVVDAMREYAPLAWLELNDSVRQDPVAKGNALARAINAVLPAPLLSMALPFGSHIAALHRYRDDLLPMRIALTLRDLDDPLVAALADLHGDGYAVLLDVSGLAAEDDSNLEGFHVISEYSLRVTLSEARQMAPGALSSQQVEQFWREADGRFTRYNAAAQRAAGLPQLNVPSSGGPLLPVDEAVLIDPGPAIAALQREGDLVGALELAVLRAPELVEDLLRTAGPRYQEEGLLERLHLLLSALPEGYARTERVLEWRIPAGLAANDYHQAFEDADSFLRTHEAPALRARRAGTLPHSAGFALAEQAVQARRSPLTVWQYGRLHPNHEIAIKLLRESVQLAEVQGMSYEVARNADSLATRLSQAGEFARAASWARWALDVFDREQLLDGNRRLLILNNLANARIMSDDLVGLRGILQDARTLVEDSLPLLAVLFRSTLAQLELADDDREAALALLESTYIRSYRRHRARYGYQLVRVLTGLDRLDEARKIAADVTEITVAGEPHERSLAGLARGIVAAMAGEKEEATSDLLEAMLDTDLVAEQRLTATLYYLLASGGAAHNVPAGLAPLLAALPRTGLKVLSGPPSRFESIWATLTGPREQLSMKFLGRGEVRYRGREVQLPPRLAEVAFALAANPDGLTRDELSTFLTPDGHAPFTPGGLRSMMTRLRASLPVSDAPYRFTVPYSADYLEVRRQLASGNVREAIALMPGSLLPLSDAPGVVESREELEEQVRQAALMVSDPDALFDLAERFDDDLEFWLAAAEALSTGDPRLALARARVRRLEDAYLLGS